MHSEPFAAQSEMTVSYLRKTKGRFHPCPKKQTKTKTKNITAVKLCFAELDHHPQLYICLQQNKQTNKKIPLTSDIPL